MASSRHYRQARPWEQERLLRELQGAQGVNGLRRLCQKYLSLGFRRALAEQVPEFFLMYYLGFRLPPHQIRWIHMIITYQFLLELAPRDHGKSWIFSYGMPLWEIYADLVRNNMEGTNTRILEISKTDEQAGKFATQVRETIEKNRYLHADFGDIRDMSEWHKGSFRCKRRVEDSIEKDFTYEKTGVLGAITGGHFSRVNLDDPLDDENTKTPERMETVENWFWGTIWNLREPTTAYSMVGTRKNRKDLYSRILETSTWKSVVEAAIIKWPMIPDPERPNGDMIQGWRYITDKGRKITHLFEREPNETPVDIELLTEDYKVLWPPVPAVNNDGQTVYIPNTDRPAMFGWGIKDLLLDRATSGPTYFDREKQNAITSGETQIFQKEWFKFFDTNQLIFNPTDNHYYLEGVNVQ